MPEFEIYNRGVITPQEFMRPPSEGLNPFLSWKALQLEGEINDSIVQLVNRTHPSATPILRVGTEIELSLFYPDLCPIKGTTVRRLRNPNYSDEHNRNVENFKESLDDVKAHGGLRHVLLGYPGRAGTISTELRTVPSNVAEYIRQMDEVKDGVQRFGSKYSINPSVISQHFHMSLYDYTKGFNAFDDFKIKNAVHNGLIDIYRRAIPLLRPPEYVNSKNVYTMGDGIDCGIKWKGGGDNDPVRIEGRMNNFGYGFDPYMNLVLNLAGIKRGLMYVSNPDEIDKDDPLKRTLDTDSAYFRFGYGYPSYQELLAKFQKDPVMRELFGDMADKIYSIYSVYPDISRGKHTSVEARGKAEQILFQAK